VIYFIDLLQWFIYFIDLLVSLMHFIDFWDFLIDLFHWLIYFIDLCISARYNIVAVLARSSTSQSRLDTRWFDTRRFGTRRVETNGSTRDGFVSTRRPTLQTPTAKSRHASHLAHEDIYSSVLVSRSRVWVRDGDRARDCFVLVIAINQFISLFC